MKKKPLKVLHRGAILSAATVILGTSILATGGAAEAKQKRDDVIHLKLWHAMGSVPGAALQHIIDDFNKSQSKIQVTAVYQGNYDDEFNKWKQSAGSSDGPSIMQVYDIGTKFMIDSKEIVPMQNFINQSHYDLSQLEPNIYGYYQVNKELYSMPFNSSQPVIYYNENMFKAAGITAAPKTFDDVVTDAKKLTQKQGDKVNVYGIGLATYGWFFEQMLAGQNALFANNENGRTGTPATAAVFNNQAGLNIVNWWKSLVDAGVDLNPGPTTSLTQTPFAAGKIAMTMDSTATYTSLVKAAAGKFKIGIAPMPKPAGATGGPIIGGGSLWIMKNQSQQEQQAAWQFVRFVSSPAEQAYWSTATGYFPTTRAAYKTATIKNFLKTNPQFNVAVQQLHTTKLTPATQGAAIGVFTQARSIVQNSLQSALAGKQTPQQALDDAAGQITQAIQNYNLTVN